MLIEIRHRSRARRLRSTEGSFHSTDIRSDLLYKHNRHSYPHYHLIPLLLKSSDPRLLFLTSGTASFERSLDPYFFLNKSPVAGWPKPPQREMWAYKSSKVALNMLMRDWYRTLKNGGVKVWCVNPGFVVAGLGGDPETLKSIGAGDAAESGKTVRSVVEGERDDETGSTVQKKHAA
ncbi:hypothetical protein IAT40_005999 [Kwoniella sp. CBS 6097]